MRLVQGKGSKETGACWMSAIAWYEGNSNWTDAPDCVCPIIRELAIWVNDKIDSDEERERLISPIMFSVVGTANPDLMLPRRRKVVAFAAAKARSVLHLVPTECADVSRKAIEAAEAWAEDPSEENRNAANDACKAAYEAANDACNAAYDAAYATAFAAAACTAVSATDFAAHAAAYAASVSRIDSTGLVNEIINLILELAAMEEKQEVIQLRKLEALSYGKSKDQQHSS
jgi:hypothetical protein